MFDEIDVDDNMQITYDEFKKNLTFIEKIIDLPIKNPEKTYQKLGNGKLISFEEFTNYFFEK